MPVITVSGVTYTYADRALMGVSAAPGTGTFALAGTAPGARTFEDAGVLTGANVRYVAESNFDAYGRAQLWEVGLGVYTKTPTETTLARSTVHASSSGGPLVAFGADVQVSLAFTAEDILVVNNDILALSPGAIPFGATPSGLTTDVTQLAWDDTNNRLGIGTQTPYAKTQIIDTNYQPTETNFLGQPSGVPNGVGNGLLSIYVKRTGGVGQYGYNFTLVEVEAASTGDPLNRRSDHALTAWINANNVMSGGRINGFWLGANSPPTARGKSFASGTVSGGEIDYGNLSGDFGIRTTFSNVSSTLGLMIAPDPTPNTLGAAYESTTVAVGTPAVFTRVAHGYAAGMGIKFYGAQAVAAGLTEGTVYYVITAGLAADTYQISTTREGAALALAGSPTGAFNALPSWPGTFGLIMAGSVHGHQTGTQIHIQENSIRPNGYGIYAKGSSVAAPANAPAAIISGLGTWTRGIDFQSQTFISDAIRLADDQTLRFGSATMKGQGTGSWFVTTFGTGTTGKLLANGGAQEAMRWGSNGTPAAILGFYGATPVVQPSGYGTVVGAAKISSFDAGTATLAQTAGHLAALVADLKSLGVVGA